MHHQSTVVRGHHEAFAMTRTSNSTSLGAQPMTFENRAGCCCAPMGWKRWGTEASTVQVVEKLHNRISSVWEDTWHKWLKAMQGTKRKGRIPSALQSKQGQSWYGRSQATLERWQNTERGGLELSVYNSVTNTLAIWPWNHYLTFLASLGPRCRAQWPWSFMHRAAIEMQLVKTTTIKSLNRS